METEKKKQGFTLFNTLSLIEGCRLQIINKMNEAKKRKSKSMKKNENYLFAQPDGSELCVRQGSLVSFTLVLALLLKGDLKH